MVRLVVKRKDCGHKKKQPLMGCEKEMYPYFVEKLGKIPGTQRNKDTTVNSVV